MSCKALRRYVGGSGLVDTNTMHNLAMKSSPPPRVRRTGLIVGGVIAAALTVAVVRTLVDPPITLSAAASARLPGMLTTRAAWPSNTAELRARLPLLDLGGVGGLRHIHVFLAIIIHGRRVPVPPDIGLAADAESPLHVHEGEAGIVHVESWDPFWRATLGEFFDAWGVRLFSKCIGGYCTTDADELRVFVGGTRYRGNPRTLPLTDHEDIVVAFGTEEEVPSPLPAFDWSRFSG